MIVLFLSLSLVCLFFQLGLLLLESLLKVPNLLFLLLQFSLVALNLGQLALELSLLGLVLLFKTLNPFFLALNAANERFDGIQQSVGILLLQDRPGFDGAFVVHKALGAFYLVVCGKSLFRSELLLAELAEGQAGAFLVVVIEEIKQRILLAVFVQGIRRARVGDFIVLEKSEVLVVGEGVELNGELLTFTLFLHALWSLEGAPCAVQSHARLAAVRLEGLAFAN